ncbi:Putative glycosyltransferase EpsE [Prosthecochloris sp. CIB 2401]|nr:Putative glycosyltransferase EpsE [Prosthecochloris sp. CIB 2401]
MDYLEGIEKKFMDSYEVDNNVISAVPSPLVSIRTSTYQHVKYIGQCIEGVLMQKTNFPIEYIIGEDYSTDGTREIVLEYARKYPHVIRVITADYNVGAKANGRRCENAIRGKYVALCEGDDYWTDPYKLQKQVDSLEENPEYGMVFTRCCVLDMNTNTITDPDPDYTIDFFDKYEKEILINKIIEQRIRIRTPAVLYRKKSKMRSGMN